MNIETAEEICRQIEKEPLSMKYFRFESADLRCWQYLFLQPHICKWEDVASVDNFNVMKGIYLVKNEYLAEYMVFLKGAIHDCLSAVKKIETLIQDALNGDDDSEVSSIVGALEAYPSNSSFSDLAIYFSRVGNFSISVKLFQKAVAGYTDELGVGDEKTLTARMNLGTALSCSGER